VLRGLVGNALEDPVGASDPRATSGGLSAQDQPQSEPEGAAGGLRGVPAIEALFVRAGPEVVGLGVVPDQVGDGRPARKVVRDQRLIAVRLCPQSAGLSSSRAAERLACSIYGCVGRHDILQPACPGSCP